MIPNKEVNMQGAVIDVSMGVDDEKALAIFEAEQIDDRGQVIATWKMRFFLTPFELKCLSQKSDEAAVLSSENRAGLSPDIKFKLTAEPGDKDENPRS